MTGSLRTVAIDVDGTLLDPAHELRPAVRAAVREMSERSIGVVLASGRYLPSLVWILAQLGIAEATLLGCSGGTAMRVRKGQPDELLFESRLDRALTLSLAREALAANLHVAWYAPGCWYAPSGEGWYAEETQILGHAPIVAPDFSAIEGEPNKLQLVAPDAGGIAVMQALQQRLKAQAAGQCSAVFSHSDMLEILPAGVDKAQGLRRLGALGDLDLDATLAFGDAENDMEMLAEAGFGIAMGNATDALKAVADWVTLPNSEDGIAHALNQPWLRARLGVQA